MRLPAYKCRVCGLPKGRGRDHSACSKALQAGAKDHTAKGGGAVSTYRSPRRLAAFVNALEGRGK